MPGGFHTFTVGEVLTAANVNTYLMNQMVAQVTSGTRPASPVAGQTIYQTDNNLYLTYDGVAWVTTTPVTAVVATSETTTAGTFGDLTTPGPSVSVQTGTSALVVLSALMAQSNGGDYAVMGYAISGATTSAASSNGSILTDYGSNLLVSQAGNMVQSLTAGLNTFTAKYEVITGGTATFAHRAITVFGTP